MSETTRKQGKSPRINQTESKDFIIKLEIEESMYLNNAII
jgi:hypothetical protein